MLAVIAPAQLVVVLDLTIVVVALPHIQAALGFSGSNLEWVVNAYAVAFGGLLLLGGRAGDLHRPQRYQIRVRGRLGQIICSAFAAFQAQAEGGDSVLTGVLADQAALYGVLAEAEALGLELIEVRRLPE